MQNDLRMIVTLLGLLCFIGICVWAYGKRSRNRFDDIAQQVIADDDSPSSGRHS
ncbi:cbb3-type cytochrome oxidase subunit 3 [Chitinilyticum litopenaei]|uniref:cbb3-type cytochrome oxidase subunit 3 n=1 Tax=Chitinilyticum litopenaei TaxID=1121276 RepID=UPI001FE042DE|nr:cbb3-type cytochrome c oxidase subunit 3 [Chitinilyticum litopenaei]